MVADYSLTSVHRTAIGYVCALAGDACAMLILSAAAINWTGTALTRSSGIWACSPVSLKHQRQGQPASVLLRCLAYSTSLDGGYTSWPFRHLCRQRRSN